MPKSVASYKNSIEAALIQSLYYGISKKKGKENAVSLGMNYIENDIQVPYNLKSFELCLILLWHAYYKNLINKLDKMPLFGHKKSKDKKYVKI